MSSTCFTWSLRQLAKLLFLASINPYLSVRVLFQGKHFFNVFYIFFLRECKEVYHVSFFQYPCFFFTNLNDGNCRWFWTLKPVAIFEMIWFSFRWLSKTSCRKDTCCERVFMNYAILFYRWGFFTLRWEHSAVTLWLQIINVDISCHIPACFVSPLINGSGWFSLFREAPDKTKPSHNVRPIKSQSIQIKKGFAAF